MMGSLKFTYEVKMQIDSKGDCVDVSTAILALFENIKEAKISEISVRKVYKGKDS